MINGCRHEWPSLIFKFLLPSCHLLPLWFSVLFSLWGSQVGFERPEVPVGQYTPEPSQPFKHQQQCLTTFTLFPTQVIPSSDAWVLQWVWVTVESDLDLKENSMGSIFTVMALKHYFSKLAILFLLPNDTHWGKTDDIHFIHWAKEGISIQCPSTSVKQVFLFWRHSRYKVSRGFVSPKLVPGQEAVKLKKHSHIMEPLSFNSLLMQHVAQPDCSLQPFSKGRKNNAVRISWRQWRRRPTITTWLQCYVTTCFQISGS